MTITSERNMSYILTEVLLKLKKKKGKAERKFLGLQRASNYSLDGCRQC